MPTGPVTPTSGTGTGAPAHVGVALPMKMATLAKPEQQTFDNLTFVDFIVAAPGQACLSH
jgi:hypothetical protein